MPIEFSCPRCKKLVRTPDSTAGKKGQCPSCKEVVQIPTASTSGPTAATIEFACHQCGKSVKTPSSAAGKKGKCPSCQAVVNIPAEGGVAPTEPAQDKQKGISFDCPECGNQVRTPLSTAGKKGRCPKCKTLVKIPERGGKPKKRLNLMAQLGAGHSDKPERPKLDLLSGLDASPAPADKPRLDLLGSLSGPGGAQASVSDEQDEEVDDLIAGVMSDDSVETSFKPTTPRKPKPKPKPKPRSSSEADVDELVANVGGAPVWKGAVDDELTVGVSIGDSSVKNEIAPQSARRLPADHFLDGLGLGFVSVLRLDVVSSEEVELLQDLPEEEFSGEATTLSLPEDSPDEIAETATLSVRDLPDVVMTTSEPEPEALSPEVGAIKDVDDKSKEPESEKEDPVDSEEDASTNGSATTPQHHRLPTKLPSLDRWRGDFSGTLGLVGENRLDQEGQDTTSGTAKAESVSPKGPKTNEQKEQTQPQQTQQAEIRQPETKPQETKLDETRLDETKQAEATWQPAPIKVAESGADVQVDDGDNVSAKKAETPAPVEDKAAIEFACTHCGETVVTPAETAGKKGQCPECGEIVRIPGEKNKAKPKLAKAVKSAPKK